VTRVGTAHHHYQQHHHHHHNNNNGYYKYFYYNSTTTKQLTVLNAREFEQGSRIFDGVEIPQLGDAV
jgi:hypothetical protein